MNVDPAGAASAMAPLISLLQMGHLADRCCITCLVHARQPQAWRQSSIIISRGASIQMMQIRGSSWGGGGGGGGGGAAGA